MYIYIYIILYVCIHTYHIYIYIYIYIYHIYIYIHINWVNTNGAAAKISFDRSGKKARPGTLRRQDKVNGSTPKVRVKRHQIAVITNCLFQNNVMYKIHIQQMFDT